MRSRLESGGISSTGPDRNAEFLSSNVSRSQRNHSGTEKEVAVANRITVQCIKQDEKLYSWLRGATLNWSKVVEIGDNFFGTLTAFR